MCTSQSVEEASELIGRMLACMDDGTYSITTLVRTGSGGGHYASFTALLGDETTLLSGSDLACAEATSKALHSGDGGNLIVSFLDEPDGVPRVRMWRLLAGEAIPMSAEEGGDLHMTELGGTPVMPMTHVGCMDAYPIPRGSVI
jgi:hypothetical protein